MTINTNYGCGITPQPHERPRSSGLEGGITAAGVAALAAGGYALEKRLNNPERFAELVINSKPTREIADNLNRFQKPLAQARFGVEHFGNFVKKAANTKPGKGALAFTALSALTLGALSAFNADKHNRQLVDRLHAKNSILATTIPPMDTII